MIKVTLTVKHRLILPLAFPLNFFELLKHVPVKEIERRDRTDGQDSGSQNPGKETQHCEPDHHTFGKDNKTKPDP